MTCMPCILVGHVASNKKSLSQERMGRTCDLETVEPQEIPVKVCVLFCNALSD